MYIKKEKADPEETTQREPEFNNNNNHVNVKQELPNETMEKCSVCWNKPPINAVKLDCNHIFCFLCIKSATTRSRKCPLCRKRIKKDFEFDQFHVIGQVKFPLCSHDEHYWFYKGKTGWWLYDADTTDELEKAYQTDKKLVERVIAGKVYVLSLTKLKQYQKNNPTRARTISRDKLESKRGEILGMAGLRDKQIIRSIQHQQQQQRQQPHSQPQSQQQHQADIKPVTIQFVVTDPTGSEESMEFRF